MNNPIEYTGTPAEWKQAYFGDIANKAIKANNGTKQVTMYKLLYRGQIVLNNAPYAVCMAKLNQCKKDKNYINSHLKITKL